MIRLNLSRLQILFLLAGTALIILLGVFIINERTEELKHHKYLESVRDMTQKLHTYIAEKKDAMLLIAYTLAQDATIHQALHANNHEALAMEDFVATLIQNTSLEDIRFHIVTADAKSFYRSWTQKRGDDLREVRIDVVEMLQDPKPRSLISTGIYDITFKAMVPIYYEKKFIGIVEAISKTNSLVSKLKKDGYEGVMIVDKSYKKQLAYPFTKHFIDDYYVATPNVAPELLTFIQKHSLEELINNRTYILDSKAKLLSTTSLIPDISGAPMAYMLLFTPTDRIDLADIFKDRNYIYFMFFMFLFLVGGSLLWFYVRRTNRFIQNMNDMLVAQVEEKTRDLRYIAHHDTLTSLPNRLLFIDRLKQAILHAKSNDTSVYVLFLDLDRFKEINDSFGHERGDKLLIAISKRLKRTLRKVDTVARLGGDEFTILIEDVDLAHVTRLLQNILGSMRKPVMIDDTPTYSTFSIGISRFPEDGKTPEILIRNADTAMYRAKEEGKNRYQFYDAAMTQKTMQRLTLETNLRKAIQENRLEPYFQAQVEGKSKKVIGVEALVRWRDPERGIIPPIEFIPLAEEIGIVSLIDEWMMQRCFECIKKLQNADLFCGKLSLNLSVKQLEKPLFLEKLKQFLAEEDFDPRYLELEVTESQIMQNPEAAIDALHTVKSLGISIAVDDFGTGYSSLSYLKRLPIDKLKIDRSFIKELPQDSEDAAIVKAIVALAKSLNIELIAEGVETEEQKEFLLREGCAQIQGYLYSRPLPLKEFEEFLKGF